MSVASADAALLSAARAYASLKMTQHSSSPTPSSNPITSTPSTPTVQTKKAIHYSRSQLLALYDSPLCVRPADLKPLAEWFGECDLSNPPKSLSNHSLPNPNLSSNNRSSQLATHDPNASHPAQSATGLPLLGRSQPPARNPFANFGKFGAEEFNSNPFNSSNLNGSNHSLNNPSKGTRRIMDRDCAPHIGRADHQTNDGNRRRPNDPVLGAAHKDRIGNQRAAEDQPPSDSKSNNRRILDRYVPDRDRDDHRLRNRERERERDTEREKNRRSSLNPRDGPVSNEPLNWRRSPAAAPLQLNNNKHNPPDHHSTNPRVDKDTHDTRDPSNREKVREKIPNNTSNSHSSQRNPNHQRAREAKENGDSYSSSSQLTPTIAALSASRNTPPISPNVPLSAHIPRRAKDGAWDWGQGKWEISKSSNSLQNDAGGAPNEADAIQTWKAEMKALEAKKKLATAASLSTLDGLEDRSANRQSPLEAEDGFMNSPRGTKDLHFVAPIEVHSKKDGADPSFTPDSTSDHSHKQLGFTSLANPSLVDPTHGAHSHDVIENELTVLPRASRFAKFFDHNKHDGPQSASLPKDGHQSDGDSPSKATGSPSADPENMARVLSMLQMSSKQNLEPGPDHASNSNSHSSSFQVNNKLEASNGQQSLHNYDLAGFLQPQNASPPFSHARGMRSFTDAESKDRTRTVDHNTLGQPHASNAYTLGANENSASNSLSSQPVGVSGNEPFNLFPTINHPTHSKTPNETGSGALRNQEALDPQMLQLQHMLHSVNNPNNLGNIPAQQLAQERHSENQNLAFLTRQLHQQRVSPSHVINQVSGVNNLSSLMSLNPTSSALLSNSRQGFNQFEHQHQQSALDYQRVPVVAPTQAGNGVPHTLQNLNSGAGLNGIFQLPPVNAPHSSLSNLFLHQQAPAHHPAIIPPAVNFNNPSAAQTAIGNGRPGPANFAHQAPQILSGLQHHPMNHHQQLQLQQLQRLQRQQGLHGGTFANHAANSNMNFPFMGGPTNRGFGPGFGNVNGVGIVPLINNLMGTNSSGSQQLHGQQPPPSPLANTSGLPGLQPGGAGLTHPFQQHQLGNLPPQSVSNSQAHSAHSQLDLLSLLNAGNQRRIGM